MSSSSESSEKSFGVIPFKRTKSGLKFLLIKHAQGHWGFPKGHPEGGESSSETALRELREEAGVTNCNIIGDKTWEQTYEIERSGISVKKTVEYYLGEVLSSGEAADGDEILQCLWCDFTEAERKLTYKENRDILRSVLSLLSAPG